MSKGAWITKIDGNEIAHKYPFYSTNEIISELTQKLNEYTSLETRSTIAGPVITIKYDPNFNWDD